MVPIVLLSHTNTRQNNSKFLTFTQFIRNVSCQLVRKVHFPVVIHQQFHAD